MLGLGDYLINQYNQNLINQYNQNLIILCLNNQSRL